jgi:hypothetical protein
LDLIATSENPRYNALIDTGALITGYSNKEVAEELLKRGLTWCDGVIFLDDEDRQQVLVRATGRVVSADQCGVSLDKRFAFYDQIHTTGMDIKHVVNATAVITLGKDMVFRDYVQGAYRMRGIGTGQKIHVLIIPEVLELMSRELKSAVVRDHPLGGHVLEDVVAWLVINTLRSEQTQWTMLCLQNISNLYRKNAYKCLQTSGVDYFAGNKEKTLSVEAQPRKREEGTNNAVTIASDTDETKAQTEDVDMNIPSEQIAAVDTAEVERETSIPLEDSNVYDHMSKDVALKIFEESIDFTLESGVPDPLPFEEKLRRLLDTHESFLLHDQHAIGHR